jgi:hypothetical protein
MFSKRLHRRNILQIIGILPLFATSVDIALADDPKTSIIGREIQEVQRSGRQW